MDESGELQSIDGYMNLALEKCEEHVDGKKRRSYGDAFVRGNNGQPFFAMCYVRFDDRLLMICVAVMYISAD